MVVMTAKVSKRKILAILLVIALAVVLLSVLLSNSGKAAEGTEAAEQTQQAAQAPEQIKSNEDRIAYLAAYGWEVEEEPVQTQEVRVPTDPNEVFQRYNDLQKSQGFDLDALAGKSLKRYVYEIKNYPGGEGTYYATILVYKNQVVGGDVCSAEKGGVMHDLKMPK